jgi:hypothetical protein
MEILKTKANIILDASKVDLFETCPKRYHFRHNLNRTLPIIHKARALDIGSLAHEGLAVYYRMLGEQAHYDDRMESCLMKIRELSSNPDESNAEPEEVNNLLKTIEECCDFWRADDENSIEVLAVEQAFAYSLFEDDDIRIILSGKIDLLMNYRGIGGSASYSKMPLDHKTFSRESMLLRKSNQFINYCNAVGSNYLLVNRIGLHNGSVKSPKPATEKFKRLPLSYDPQYIEDWKKNLTSMILNEYLTCVATGDWVEKPTSCYKFNRLCEYFEICDSSGQDSKDRKLEDNYVTIAEWDVTSKMTGVE